MQHMWRQELITFGVNAALNFSGNFKVSLKNVTRQGDTNKQHNFGNNSPLQF